MSIRAVSNGIEKGINWVANSKVMKKAFSERAGEMAATIALWSTTTKDAVNCYYYTNQSLHNEKIPEEKRKFVAAIDLANGFMNVVSQLTLGAYIKNKLPQTFDKMFKNTTLTGGTLKAAKNGFVVLGTLVFAQIILKRVLTPFLATPLAHYIKEYGEKHMASKKNQNPAADSVSENKPEQENLNNTQAESAGSAVSIAAANSPTFKSFQNMLTK